MRVLVTGGAGFLGGAVARLAAARGDEVAVTVHRRAAPAGVEAHRVDLRDGAAVGVLLERARPELVVHTAYDASDWAATAIAPAHLARAAGRAGAALVHVSSDAVFSGSQVAYAEDDLPDPVNPYGAAKAAAETAVRAVLPTAAVVRTSLLLGGPGSAMEEYVRAVVHGERDGVMFTDDVRCAAHVDDVAAGLLALGRTPGVHHLAGPEAVSRMEIARLVCAREGWPTARLRPGLRAQLPVPGPLDLRLSCAQTLARRGVVLRGAGVFLRPGRP